jgi:putative hemin transport protein
MICVGHRGCIQVLSGAVERIVRHGPWLDVLDPGFNLHLREDRIASSWVAAKPTRSGVVRSLELFDRVPGAP